MPLTANSRLFAAVDEGAINQMLIAAMRQRPTLFNYGTQIFVSGTPLCERLVLHPEIVARNLPTVTLMPYLPVIGAPQIVLEYCFQITGLVVDFHPSNSIPLPTQLGSALQPQGFALRATIAAGLICPEGEVLDRWGIIGVERAETPAPLTFAPPRIPPQPLGGRTRHCFVLEVHAIGQFTRQLISNEWRLLPLLSALEIVDIAPVPLEAALECYLSAVLKAGLLPRLALPLAAVTMRPSPAFGAIDVGLTPVSPAVPFNPAVADDQLQVSLDLRITP